MDVDMPEWHKTSEKLPPENSYCWVWDGVCIEMAAYQASVGLEDDAAWWVEDRRYPFDTMTHWLLVPKPEPPEQEDEPSFG